MFQGSVGTVEVKGDSVQGLCEKGGVPYPAKEAAGLAPYAPGHSSGCLLPLHREP